MCSLNICLISGLFKERMKSEMYRVLQVKRGDGSLGDPKRIKQKKGTMPGLGIELLADNELFIFIIRITDKNRLTPQIMFRRSLIHIPALPMRSTSQAWAIAKLPAAHAVGIIILLPINPNSAATWPAI